MKHFTCKDCGYEIEFLSGTIIVECEKCQAIYAIGDNLTLQLSGIKTLERKKLNPDKVLEAITQYQSEADW